MSKRAGSRRRQEIGLGATIGVRQPQRAQGGGRGSRSRFGKRAEKQKACMHARAKEQRSDVHGPENGPPHCGCTSLIPSASIAAVLPSTACSEARGVGPPRLPSVQLRQRPRAQSPEPPASQQATQHPLGRTSAGAGPPPPVSLPGHFPTLKRDCIDKTP